MEPAGIRSGVEANSRNPFCRSLRQCAPGRRQENPAERISRRQERSRCLDVFFPVQATLREVKARKTPSASSDVGGVFVWRSSSSHPRDFEPCDPASLIIAWRRNRYGHFGVWLRGKVRHARVVGNLDQCDRVRGLPRRRDLSPIAKQQIAGSLSATVGRRSASRPAW